MKIQVDTITKTIKVEKEVNLFEFVEFIKKIFPDGEWKEYNLSTETIINLSYPIIYRSYPNWIINPIQTPTITYQTGGNIHNIPSHNGVYNIES
jgi:hypothetical protein